MKAQELVDKLNYGRFAVAIEQGGGPRAVEYAYNLQSDIDKVKETFATGRIRNTKRAAAERQTVHVNSNLIGTVTCNYKYRKITIS
jgi:hypothetical protein